MPPDLLAELAQIEGIEAVKQANADDLQPIDGLAVLAGNDDLLAPCLDLGEPGGICVSSHVVGPGDAAHDRRARAPRGDRRVAARRLRDALPDREPDLHEGGAEPPRPRRRHAPAAHGRGRRGRDGGGPRDARAPRAHARPARRPRARSTPLERHVARPPAGRRRRDREEHDGRRVRRPHRRRGHGPALPDRRADGHRPRAARLHVPARAGGGHRGRRHHPRPRGPPRRAAVDPARARADERARGLRRPAHRRHGALQARRAQAARGGARGPAHRARSPRPGRSASSSSTSRTRSRTRAAWRCAPSWARSSSRATTSSTRRPWAARRRTSRGSPSSAARACCCCAATPRTPTARACR